MSEHEDFVERLESADIVDGINVPRQFSPKRRMTRDDVVRECNWLIEEHASSAAKKWSDNDLLQRAIIRYLNREKDRVVEENHDIYGRIMQLEDNIRDSCGPELNLLSNMGISFLEKAFSWYNKKLKSYESSRRQTGEV